jgi:hypothetical protein
MVSCVTLGDLEIHPEVSVIVGLDLGHPDSATVQVIININPTFGREIIAGDPEQHAGDSVVRRQAYDRLGGLGWRNRERHGYQTDNKDNQGSRYPAHLSDLLFGIINKNAAKS